MTAGAWLALVGVVSLAWANGVVMLAWANAAAADALSGAAGALLALADGAWAAGVAALAAAVWADTRRRAAVVAETADIEEPGG